MSLRRRTGWPIRPAGAIVVALTAVATVLVAGSPAAAAPTCSHVRSSGPWKTVDQPTSSGYLGLGLVGTGVERVVADPLDPQRLLLVFARSVLRTTDGGCTWKTVFNLDDTAAATSKPVPRAAAPVDPLYFIDSVQVVPKDADPNHEYVYVVATEGLGNAATFEEIPTLFAVSTDGGGHFSIPQPTPSAFAPEGTPTCATAVFQVAPSDPKTGYLWCAQPRCEFCTLYGSIVFVVAVYSDPVFVTHDAGQSWTMVTQPLTAQYVAGLAPPEELEGQPFAVDPLNPKTIWTSNPPGDQGTGKPFTIYRSTDGGVTWKSVFVDKGSAGSAPMPSSGGGAWDTMRLPNGSAALLFWTKFGVAVSVDDGKTWRVSMPPDVERWPVDGATLAGRGSGVIAIMEAGSFAGGTSLCDAHASAHVKAVELELPGKTWSSLPTPTANPLLYGMTATGVTADHNDPNTVTFVAAGYSDSHCKTQAPPVLLSYADASGRG